MGLLVDGKFIPADKLLYTEAAELRRLLARPDAVVQLCFGHSRKRAFTVLANGIESVFPGKLDGAAADAAESDGFLVIFLRHKIGLPDPAISKVLTDFRDYRDAQRNP